jgi:hypothetical protein
MAFPGFEVEPRPFSTSGPLSHCLGCVAVASADLASHAAAFCGCEQNSVFVAWLRVQWIAVALNDSSCQLHLRAMPPNILNS